MNWLQKLPQNRRAQSGLEWRLWRKLPWIALVGTLLPLLALGLMHLMADANAGAAEARSLQLVDYMVGGALVVHWSLLVTMAIGCVIVMVMKGPGYVADGYSVSHSDQPRASMQTDEEATAQKRQFISS